VKKLIAVLIFIMAAVSVILYSTSDRQISVSKNGSYEDTVDTLISEIAEYAQMTPAELLVNGRSMAGFDYGAKFGENMEIYCSEDFLEDVMGCCVLDYADGDVKVERNKKEIYYSGSELMVDADGTFIPVSDVIGDLGYSVEYVLKDNSVNFTNNDGGDNLPNIYDLRTDGRVTEVRDQGKFGTCWAFAALGSLETILLPAEENIYSVDHMSQNNGYSLTLSEGGEHTMSMAYLASWKGPVLEKDDPYGDGVTDSTLTAVKHLEEAIVINDASPETIKSAIYKYGGVESSIYMALSYGSQNSEYYNSGTNSYFYNGDETPNHAVVIVGWNDNYPKQNFAITPESDGAFICKNSWGTEFGEDGYFYISYEDVYVCSQVVVYTVLADADNYDNIYQCDMLGWVGQIGFSKPQAYFANVYTAESDENLAAVSFYATDENTTFSVYVVPEYESKESLSNRIKVGEGQTRYAGYYTVDLNQRMVLYEGQRFAVVVYVYTPGSTKPIAIECYAEGRTEDVDISDGEGYVSLMGEIWHRAESSDCNLCLKAFTVNREEELIGDVYGDD